MVTPRLRDSKIAHTNLLTTQEIAEWAKVSTKTVCPGFETKGFPQFD